MGCGGSSGMNSARVQPAMYAPSTAPSFPNRPKGSRDGQLDSGKAAGDTLAAAQAAGTRTLANGAAEGYKSTSILSTSSVASGLASDSQRRRSVSRPAPAHPHVPVEGDAHRAATQDQNLSPNPTARSKKSKFQRPKPISEVCKGQAKPGRTLVTTVPEQDGGRTLIRKSSDSATYEHKSLQDYMGEQRRQAEPLHIDPSTPANGPVLGRGSSRFSLAGTTTSSIPSTPLTPLSNLTQLSPGAGGSVLEFMREKRIRSASLWKQNRGAQESPAPVKARLNAPTPNG